MKAITIHQPWATLLAIGVKQYETRSWSTNVRGRVAIHSGKVPPPARYGAQSKDFVGAFTISQAGSWTDAQIDGPSMDGPRPLWCGVVLATAELVDCIPTAGAQVTDLERSLGDWTPGRFAWQFADLELLPGLVFAKGKQGWWTWDPEQQR